MNLPHIPGYTFEELIGEGGCGAVYRCLYEEDGVREYRAVKILNGLSVNPGLLSHALTTVTNLENHPRLAPIHTYNLGQAPYYFATDHYVHGETGKPTTLEPYLGEFRTKQAWKLVEQLIDGLAFLHKNDIVHTAVKPGNVFVERDGEIDSPTGGFKLRLAEPGQGLVAGLHVFEMGKSGFYASPEQLTNGDFSHGKGKRWDVYSFGVVAYQLITGRLPRLEALFEQHQKDAEKQKELTAALHQDDPLKFFEALQQEPQIKWPKKPKNSFEASLRDVVDQCLDLDPAKRPVDLRDVARTFENIRHGADLASLKNRHNARLRALRIKSRTFLVTTGLFVVLSLVLFGSALLGFSRYSAATFEAVKIDRAWKADVKNIKAGFVDERKALVDARESAYAERDRQTDLADQARGFLQFSQEHADRFFDIVMRSEDVQFPGYQEDRRERMNGGLAYFEAFIKKYDGDAGFARELARAHQFIGEIKLEQGYLSQAAAELALARDLMDQLELADAEKPGFILQTARIERSISELELAREDPQKAMAALAASSDRFNQLEVSDLTLLEQVKNRYQLARIHQDLRNYAEAQAELKWVSDRLLEMRERDPGSLELKAMLAQSFSDIGFLFRRANEDEGSRALQQKAAELFAELIEDEPLVDDHYYRLAVCLNQQGDFLGDNEKLKDAHELLSRVVSLNPTHHEYLYEMAYSYGRMAEIQRAEGQQEEAHQLNELALGILRDLNTREPNIERFQFMLAKQEVEAALLLIDKGEFEKAASGFEGSITVFNELITADADNDDYLRVLSQTLGHCGFAYEKLDQDERAKGLYERAQQIWNLFLEIQPEDEIAKDALQWLQTKIDETG